MKVVIIPGMGCTPVSQVNWYSWFAREMKKHPSVTECVLRDFPDPYHCKESIWVPFVLNEIGIDQDTILVGHSSGAACAMRLLETSQLQMAPIRGAVLVATAYTDLGCKAEKRSQYFNRPWEWEKMKQGAKNIVIFHGEDDQLIPVEEARYIADKLKGDHVEYREMNGHSHFFEPWQELLHVMDKML